MKLCKDCKWFDDSRYCQHDISKVPDPVMGEDERRTCYEARKFDDLCGKEGKLWEAKS